MEYKITVEFANGDTIHGFYPYYDLAHARFLEYIKSDLVSEEPIKRVSMWKLFLMNNDHEMSEFIGEYTSQKFFMVN